MNRAKPHGDHHRFAKPPKTRENSAYDGAIRYERSAFHQSRARNPGCRVALSLQSRRGPGGQHVNRSETRVELLFDVAHSPSLSDEQRARILHRLAGYIDGEGMLHIVSATTRSQLENREDATGRFQEQLAAALRRQKARVATKPSRAARERRLAEKRTRASHKQMRRQVERED